jgi:hypothetical protein
VKITPIGHGRYAIPFHTAIKAARIPGLTWESGIGYVGYSDAMAVAAGIIRGLEIPARDAEPPYLPTAAKGLRPYQNEAVQFLLTHKGAILADDMGLGKTCSALTAARALKGRTLVVVPSLGGLGPAIWSNPRDGGEVKLWWPAVANNIFRPAGLKAGDISAGTQMVLIHYEILHAWSPVIAAWKPRVSIFDEGHALMSGGSQRSKAARLAARESEFRWVLTGTPMTSRPSDLWNVVDTVCPGRMGKFFDFGIRYCCPPDAPIWMADLSFKPLGDVAVGDEVVGWSMPAVGTGRKYLRKSKVLAVNRRMAEIVQITMASGRTIRCTADHRWLAAHSSHKFPYTRAIVGHDLARVIDPTPALRADLTHDAAWLAGMFDGEGSGNANGIRISQSASHNPKNCAQLSAALTRLGIPFTRRSEGGKCDHWEIAGGRQAKVNFANWCRPVNLQKIQHAVLTSRFKIADTVVAIEPAGLSEVVSLTTSTGNYVVYGYASKNCDAHQENVTPTKAVWKFDGASREEELGARLAHFMLRRTRTDVGSQLPAKQRQLISLQVPRKPLPKDLSKTALRKHLEVAADAKLDQVEALLLDHLANGRKVVCFTYRRAVAERLANAAASGGYKAAVIHGGIAPLRRVKAIESIAAASGGALLTATIDSAGLGINLSFAATAVFAEITWEPHEVLQAEARLGRVAGGEAILIQYPIATGTVDEFVVAKVLAKLKIRDKTVGSHDDNLSRTLSPDDGEDVFAAIAREIAAPAAP